MGSNRKLIFGAVLLVAGLVFWGLMNALGGAGGKRVANSVAPPAQTVALPPSGRMIAYAASDIPQGTLVTKNMIEMRALQGSGPTTPFITDPQGQAFGYVTGTRIPKGALIRPSDDFVGHISEVGIAGMLQPGKRAIVIPFANKPTLHDLVAIGNYVDVNAAFDGQEARTIVPAVRVLAVDVFGSDFPQVNIARRGAYKADARVSGSAPAPNEAAPAPGTTPTPTPTPGQGGGRPDPAVTLEVTPEQANRILLAQASGGVLDFVVLPTRSEVLVGGNAGGVAPGVAGGLPVSQQLGSVGGLTTISAVTRPQLAPYAERKKNSGGNQTPSTRVASASERFLNRAGNILERTSRPPLARPLGNAELPALPPLPPATVGGGTSGSSNPEFPGAGSGAGVPAESPTYNIPIYADGRTVRVENVPRPQE